ncbi:Protein of unknown function (DUF3000) [Stackebrandtia albiflava]|uniref:DUF3000 family protein n=1 Tax=Stackebrandtia albiflava TaxID=406432 RepID=A0A562VBN7_9ACTN|nr:DUF3000 family protein [Stackebrandtia albiflava]TWJ15231.1 Protein of unknown function (DUF3000) [Stackebrandtia albiflava]
MAAATALGDQAPGIFRDAVASLRAWRPDRRISITEISAPRGIAPYAFAVSAEVGASDSPGTSGRLVLLHDPAGHPAWEGTLRLVTHLSVAVDEDMYTDPVLSTVAWAWLVDGLTDAAADHAAIGGTVTCTTETRFGALRDPDEFPRDATEATLDIRASWSPVGTDLTPHLQGWCLLLAAAAGLPPDEFYIRAAA